ncbi:hypothetical protein [Azospirillum argentinense]
MGRHGVLDVQCRESAPPGPFVPTDYTGRIVLIYRTVDRQGPR